MWRIGFYLLIAVVVIHGLVHIMGFVAYWPLADIAELPYKITLLGDRWSVGPFGMRIYSVMWLVVAIGLVVAAITLLTGHSWWLPVMLVAVIVSLIITLLDWGNAFRGGIISFVILVPLLMISGLRIQPRPFLPYPEPSQDLIRVVMPADLPDPVARYYQAISGKDVSLINSAVITGRGRLRFAGITFPARLRFTHDAGQGYRHYIEATIFGLPLLKVNERYLDGQARMELPVGVVENEPKVDMAANLGLWGESIWLPSVFITDSRVHWQAIDDNSARLIVPFEDSQDTFMVFFDPATGLIQRMEAMRYKEASDPEKILWILEPLAWNTYQGLLIPSRSSVTWADEGRPWLVIDVEDVLYNVDIQTYIGASGL